MFKKVYVLILTMFISFLFVCEVHAETIEYIAPEGISLDQYDSSGWMDVIATWPVGYTEGSYVGSGQLTRERYGHTYHYGCSYTGGDGNYYINQQGYTGSAYIDNIEQVEKITWFYSLRSGQTSINPGSCSQSIYFYDTENAESFSQTWINTSQHKGKARINISASWCDGWAPRVDYSLDSTFKMSRIAVTVNSSPYFTGFNGIDPSSQNFSDLTTVFDLFGDQ